MQLFCNLNFPTKFCFAENCKIIYLRNKMAKKLPKQTFFEYLKIIFCVLYHEISKFCFQILIVLIIEFASLPSFGFCIFAPSMRTQGQENKKEITQKQNSFSIYNLYFCFLNFNFTCPPGLQLDQRYRYQHIFSISAFFLLSYWSLLWYNLFIILYNYCLFVTYCSIL